MLQCVLVQRNHRKNYSFRFENAWLKEEELNEVVSKGWNVEEHGGVMNRISNCATKISNWNKLKYVQQHKNLTVHMAAMEATRLSHDDEAVRRFFDAQKEYNKIMTREEVFWKQRAKMH